jgi:plasmid replication initiation protein
MAKNKQTKKDNDLVVKDNDLIIIGNRFDNMNITQMKIMNLIISKFDNRLEIEKIKESDLIFNISYSELLEKLQDKQLVANRFSETIEDLTKKQWKEIRNNNNFLFYNVFSYAKYENGILEIKLNRDLVKYFLELGGNFTKYYFDNIARFKSKYSILLYELLKANKFKKEATYSTEELLVLLKVEAKNMQRFGNFNLFILKKIQIEINETSDLYFQYSENKKPGTKIVDSITFRIYDSETNKNEYRDLRKFIAYIRKNYVNQGIMIVRDDGNEKTLTINKDGYLYFLDSFNEKIDKEKAEKIWNVMFNNQNKLMAYTPSLFE